jgi:hypothetical protein
MDTKVNTLWDIYVKDALSEARHPHDNPKHIDVNALFSTPLKHQLEKLGLCTTGSKNVADSDLVVKIEKQFGEELEKIAAKNSLPYRLILGTALLMVKDTKLGSNR